MRRKKESTHLISKGNGSGMNVDELLRVMVDKNASDLHLKVPMPPIFRIDGDLKPLDDYSPLTGKNIDSVFEQVTSAKQRTAFEKKHEIDFNYSVSNLARFRVNTMQQRGTKSIAFRYVPYETPSIDELDMPQILKELVLKPRGLILITGPTGSGKSTTLSAMINHLNENACRNVITIEDPIEFLHHDNKSIIRQRDLGDDTESYSDALINALRHDVDVIVIGEMRDLNTISTAITAAETGHLVLGTLHTYNVAQTVDRIIDMFPHSHQQQVRMQLAQVTEAVISQTLVPLKNGGQTAAFEVMVANKTIQGFIREGKTLELPRFMEHSRNDGMQTLNQALSNLVKSGNISEDEAILRSYDRVKLSELLQKEFAYNY
jgi:twitching motility protein PilT